MTRRSAKLDRAERRELAIYDGQRYCGRITVCGEKHSSFDTDDQIVGEFTSLREASNALRPRRGSGGHVRR